VKSIIINAVIILAAAAGVTLLLKKGGDAGARKAGLARVIQMLAAGKIVLRDALRVSSAGAQSGERYPSPMKQTHLPQFPRSSLS